MRFFTITFILVSLAFLLNAQKIAVPDSSTIKPWTRWWWMGNAVDTGNLKYNLKQFKSAGFGGIEITPIYGVRGYEDRFIPYLGTQWMDMLHFTCSVADELGLGVDLNNGTGWPFGGPQITRETAAKKVFIKKSECKTLKNSGSIIRQIEDERANSLAFQAVNVFINGQYLTLSPTIDTLTSFLLKNQSWPVILYTLFVKNTGQQVKRAAPGGEGMVMDHYSKEGIKTYLTAFDKALLSNPPGNLRAVFNDSYEVYGADWTLDLPGEFKSRRDYDLLNYIHALVGDGDKEIVNRVRADYRQTIAELMLEEFTLPWHNWANNQGFLSRNQAHGSPGNLIDLYALADIPEIEIFGYSHFDLNAEDRLKLPVLNDTTEFLMLKFASSAANLTGKSLVSSESFTWLRDHFNVALSDIKPEVDQLFAAGVNHIFFHGSTYSPKDECWPGWLFYASTHFNPSNVWWEDLKVMNEYITTCQHYLQNSNPDNDILLYWPVADIWAGKFHDTGSVILQPLSIHNQKEWLKPSSFYKTAKWLHENGYSFDYVSDAFLEKAVHRDGFINISGRYKVLIIPECRYIPLNTQEKLIELHEDGANVYYAGMLPGRVPGIKDFQIREQKLRALQEKIPDGNVFPDNPESLYEILQACRVRKESIVEDGIECIRKKKDDDYIYFLTNLSSEPYSKWTELSVPSKYVTGIDAMTKKSGMLKTRQASNDITYCFLDLLPGQSCILMLSDTMFASNPWNYYVWISDPLTLSDKWELKCIKGGPELPGDTALKKPESWTGFKDKKWHFFSGTVEYITYFDKPLADVQAWILEFDEVKESARIWINGQKVGTLISQPWQILIKDKLKEKDNQLRIEVTNLDANRIIHLDRTDPSWKKFYDINIVDIHYEPFDASGWEPVASGLIGEVRLIPVRYVTGY